MREMVLMGGVLVFAVFGLWCVIRMAAEIFFSPPQIAVAVEIRNEEDAEMLDVLLHEAGSAFLRKGKARLVVLLASDLMDGTVGMGEDLLPEYQELLDLYHADCYLIDV